MGRGGVGRGFGLGGFGTFLEGLASSDWFCGGVGRCASGGCALNGSRLGVRLRWLCPPPQKPATPQKTNRPDRPLDTPTQQHHQQNTTATTRQRANGRKRARPPARLDERPHELVGVEVAAKAGLRVRHDGGVPVHVGAPRGVRDLVGALEGLRRGGFGRFWAVLGRFVGAGWGGVVGRDLVGALEGLRLGWRVCWGRLSCD